MSKGFWGIIAAVIVLFIGVAVLSNNDKASAPTSSKGTPTQHIKGNPDSKVVLVEYGDFQCPVCLQYEPTVNAVVSEFKDKIKFQFRHFPITSLHQNAFAASRAAEAASKQGKFWEMHDALFDSTNNQQWSQSSDPNTFFEQYAKDIGLNIEQYKKDFSSSAVNDSINADMAAGNKLGVSGTPTFFLNGQKIEIANDLKSFQQKINDALAEAKPANQ